MIVFVGIVYRRFAAREMMLVADKNHCMEAELEERGVFCGIIQKRVRGQEVLTQAQTESPPLEGWKSAGGGLRLKSSARISIFEFRI